MKIRLLFGFVLFLLVSCKTTTSPPAKSPVKTSVKEEANVPNLQESFVSKNDIQFLNQFPDDFNQFHGYFGWNEERDEPEELYDQCNSYIDYWFDLIGNEEYNEYEKTIIDICTNGRWEADAVNYFQDRSLSYIKEKKRFDLINNLKDSQAESVLFFLFDSPHPEMDTEFVSNLSASKQNIVNTLFETAISDHGMESDQSVIKTYDFDLNNDGVPDKIKVRQKGDVADEFDRNHFGLSIEVLKGVEDGWKEWGQNRCVFSSGTSCMSEGFDQIYFSKGLLTVAQQTCNGNWISVNSYATFAVEGNELYLKEYREEYFNKQDHDQVIPDKTWTEADFGKVSFEKVSEDFLRNLRK